MKRTETPGSPPAQRRGRLDGLWHEGRPRVMGVLNCTPDSFSDGGLHQSLHQALAHARHMVAEGADMIDVGGESTRPGASAVTAAEEAARVIPVIRELRREHPTLPLSIDTSKAEVAAAALDNGADLVNDVRSGRAAHMLEVVAGHRAGLVLMHMRGEPRTMQVDTLYDHVVAEVHEFLRHRAAAAVRAGIPQDRIWLDPGIGFGKDDAGNLALLRALPRLAVLGHPIVLGCSRKSFIGRLTGAAVEDRLPGSLAALIPVLQLPRAVVRVHDVAQTRQFLTIARLLGGLAA